MHLKANVALIARDSAHTASTSQIEYIRGSLKVLSSKSRSENSSKERYVVVLNANANELRIRLPEHLEGIDDKSVEHGKLTLHLNEPEADLHISSPFITELRSLCRRAYRTLEGKNSQKRNRSRKLVTKVVPDTPEKWQMSRSDLSLLRARQILTEEELNESVEETPMKAGDLNISTTSESAALSRMRTSLLLKRSISQRRKSVASTALSHFPLSSSSTRNSTDENMFSQFDTSQNDDITCAESIEHHHNAPLSPLPTNANTRAKRTRTPLKSDERAPEAKRAKRSLLL